MHSVVQQVASYAVNAAWEVVLVGGAGWGVSRLLRRFGPRVEHVLWVATLVAGVLAPGVPMIRAAAESLLAGPVAQGATVHFAMVDMAGAAVRDGVGVPEWMMVVLVLVFGLAGAYFAVRLLLRVVRVVKLQRGARPVVLSEELEQAWWRCRQAFGVKDVAILESKEVAGPVTAGFWKPVVIVPEGFLEWCRAGDFLAAMAHECAHIRRRDFKKNLLYEVAGVVVGFHPVIWFVKARLAQTREMICDEMASETVLDAYSYATSLLRLAETVRGGTRIAASPAMGIFDADVLERRIRKMKEKKWKVSGRVRGWVAGASVVTLFCVAGALSAMAGTIHAQKNGDSSGGGAVNVAPKGDLSCTYYDHGTPHPGTCVTRSGDTGEYFCAEDGSKKFELQSSCKEKVELARGAAAAERTAKREQGAGEQATASDEKAGKVYVSGKGMPGLTAPVAIYIPEPEYTRKARKAGYQGVVDLQVIVTPQGRTADIKVVRHLGMGLDEQAEKAVRKYRFKPARYHGHPVAVRMIVEVDFHLYGGGKNNREGELNLP